MDKSVIPVLIAKHMLSTYREVTVLSGLSEMHHCNRSIQWFCQRAITA
jgi:hypothetical protein